MEAGKKKRLERACLLIWKERAPLSEVGVRKERKGWWGCSGETCLGAIESRISSDSFLEEHGCRREHDVSCEREKSQRRTSVISIIGASGRGSSSRVSAPRYDAVLVASSGRHGAMRRPGGASESQVASEQGPRSYPAAVGGETGRGSNRAVRCHVQDVTSSSSSRWR